MYRIYIFRQIINTIGSCKRYDSPIQSIIKGLIKENSIIEKTAIIQKFINKRSSNTFLACFWVFRGNHISNTSGQCIADPQHNISDNSHK